MTLRRLTAILACALPLCATATTLGDLSARLKVGMWETRSTGNVFNFDASGALKERTSVSYSCMTREQRDESLKRMLGGLDGGGGGCKAQPEKVSGDAFEALIDCDSAEFGKARMRIAGTIRPELQRVEMTMTFANPPPALRGVKEMRDVTESKWLRACRADEKAGKQPGRPAP